jgi:hypothetical protein
MTYDAGGGAGHLLESLLGSDSGQRMDDDLSRMKIFIERGAPPHDAERPQQERSSLH